MAEPLKTPSDGGVGPETAPAGTGEDLPGPSCTGLRASEGVEVVPFGTVRTVRTVTQ